MCARPGDGPEGRQVPHRQGPQQANDQVSTLRVEKSMLNKLANAFPKSDVWLTRNALPRKGCLFDKTLQAVRHP